MSNRLTDIEKQAHLLDQRFLKRAFNSWNPNMYNAQQFRSGRKTYSGDIKEAIDDRMVSVYGGIRPELYNKIQGSENTQGLFAAETGEAYLKRGSGAGTLNHELAHYGLLLIKQSVKILNCMEKKMELYNMNKLIEMKILFILMTHNLILIELLKILIIIILLLIV